ncbi:MAG: hypothetical protein EON55_13290 [Alphaproteobacteria bacterium]|nr:MAG: hypothetical protein EON55_13290 [Alphaproteobacteria bacterium]
MISATRFDSILKMLAMAAHTQTNVNEAVNALQMAVKLLYQQGYALTDLRLAADEYDDGEDSGPIVLNYIRDIAKLEADLIVRERNENRLTSEIVSLKAELEKVQSGSRRIARHREVIMEIAATPTPNSTPEEVTERREEKREERIAKGKAARAGRAPRTVPDAAPKVRAARAPKAPKEPKAPRGFRWSDYPEQYDRMVAMYLAGSGKGTITKELGIEHLNPAQVHAATANGRPPAALNAQVRDSGPIDWTEAWLIGSTLFMKLRSWRGPTLDALGITTVPAAGLSFDLNEHASVESIEALRARYRAHIAAQADPKVKAADPVEEQADEQQPAEEQADAESHETEADQQAA